MDDTIFFYIHTKCIKVDERRGKLDIGDEETEEEYDFISWVTGTSQGGGKKRQDW